MTVAVGDGLQGPDWTDSTIRPGIVVSWSSLGITCRRVPPYPVLVVAASVPGYTPQVHQHSCVLERRGVHSSCNGHQLF